MQAFEEYNDRGTEFWAFVKFVSENLGYTARGTNLVKSYDEEKITQLCISSNTYVNTSLIHDVAHYCQLRADILNNIVQPNLMSQEEACNTFKPYCELHRLENYYCKLPLNKQKGEMHQTAYFTSLINILTEKTIREETGNNNKGFDDDPRGLTYIWDANRNIIGASSRRFDGAFPSIDNPLAVWEIKEYYYATTFGSRVSDGVYETQLDGHEFRSLYLQTGRKVLHILFIDAYQTWWVKGKSYLCRIIDALNEGIVDEVIVGREVLTRWPEIVRTLIHQNNTEANLEPGKGNLH